MSFCGDPTESDCQVQQKLQISSAMTIQKCFRSWKAKRLEAHEQFYSGFGEILKNADWKRFGIESEPFGQFLSIFDPKKESDVDILVKIFDWYAKCEGTCHPTM